MKGIIVSGNFIPKISSIIIDVAAITIWPFIFVRPIMAENKRLLQHEEIHIRQYNELAVVGFLMIYVFDWLRGLVKYKDTTQAYLMIRFEQEAREFEATSEYLSNRDSYAWTNYRV